MFNCTRGTQLAKPKLWYFLAAKQTCLFNEYTEQTNKQNTTNEQKEDMYRLSYLS